MISKGEINVAPVVAAVMLGFKELGYIKV